MQGVAFFADYRRICSTASGYNVFHPVIDDQLFSEFPTQSILEGKFAKVPLIVGCVIFTSSLVAL